MLGLELRKKYCFVKKLDNNVLCCDCNHNVIVNKWAGFYDVKSNEGYIFFMNSNINSSFLHRHVSLKLYLHSQNL